RKPLFDAIINYIPAPDADVDAPLRMLISNIGVDEYVGRTAVARIEQGRIQSGQTVLVCNEAGFRKTAKITYIYKFDGLKKVETDSAMAGDIILLAGLTEFNIGDTVCDPDNVDPIHFVNIDEPTLSMNFLVNNSPFAGREGTFVTSRHIRDRLYKEVETNVSMRVEDTESPDTLKVSGRGELHLSVLIETMRRQGYEFQVSRPKVIYKEINGQLCEPIEYLTVDVPEEFVGTVIEKLGTRKGEMVNMRPTSDNFTRLEFRIPARGLIGYRGEFLTDTRGNGIMNSIFDGYEPYKGDISSRTHGSMVAWEQGEAVPYGLFNAQERGALFIGPGEKVYEGMIVGESARGDDLVINVCKKKHLTNIRASGSDEALKLTPPVILSLEQALDFISDDELVEVTPKSIRLRKKILDTELRAKDRARRDSI
ncbi:MAG: translational GTPase TypA, partial [Clostridia bacterium]|nr:translational GTPase TypA [Clostridia bacterium]